MGNEKQRSSSLSECPATGNRDAAALPLRHSWRVVSTHSEGKLTADLDEVTEAPPPTVALVDVISIVLRASATRSQTRGHQPIIQELGEVVVQCGQLVRIARGRAAPCRSLRDVAQNVIFMPEVDVPEGSRHFAEAGRCADPGAHT